MSQRRHEFFHVVVHPAPQPVLLRANDYRALVRALSAALERYPVRIISYALLPTHWELVVGPADSASLTRLIEWVTTTQNARLRQIGRVAAGVSSHTIRITAVAPAVDLVRVCRFVERQPMRLELTKRAEDWPWSSLADRFRLRPKVPLVTTRFLTSRAWLDLVNRPLQPFVRSSARHLAERPRWLTGLPQRPQHAIGMRGGHNEDEAHAHVERAKHLVVRHAASTL